MSMQSDRTDTRDSPPVQVTIAAAAYAAIFMIISTIRFNLFMYGDFDLAVHAQTMHNILRGSAESSILGVPFLGNHFVLILYLLAPIYAVWASPLALLWIQTLALAAGVFPLYRIAATSLSRQWAAGISLAYLAYAPLHTMNLYEFHPVALAVPCILWAWVAYIRGRAIPFLAWTTSAVMCQENLALIPVFIGVHAILSRRRWPWIILPAILGLAYFVVVLRVMRELNPGLVGFWSLYGHLGDSPPAVVSTLVSHPFNAIRASYAPEKIAFIGSLLAPVAYTPILDPVSLVPALPVLAQRLLSNRASEFTLLYHYQAEFIPFVFIAAAGGISRILSRRPNYSRPLAYILVVFSVAALMSLEVPSWMSFFTQVRQSAANVDARRRMIASIPKGESVTATFNCLSHLSDRRNLYSLHHISTGKYTLSNEEYPTPQLDWVLMDTQDPLTFGTRGFHSTASYMKLQSLLFKPGWNLVDQENGMLLFSRNEGIPSLPPLAGEATNGIPGSACTSISWSGPDSPRPTAFTLSPLPDGKADLTIYWSTQQLLPAADFDILVQLESPSGTVASHRLTPGNRVLPPRCWQAGTIVLDRHRISLSHTPKDANKARLIIAAIGS